MIELPNTGEGLGFNVMGGKEQNCPVYISRIIPDGVAAKVLFFFTSAFLHYLAWWFETRRPVIVDKRATSRWRVTRSSGRTFKKRKGPSQIGRFVLTPSLRKYGEAF